MPDPTSDLTTLLRDAAASPSAPVDADQVHATASRRRTVTRSAGLLGLAAVAALAVGVLPGGPTPEPFVDDPTPSVTETDTDEDPVGPLSPDQAAWEADAADAPELTVQAWPAGPSQSAADAERDGVFPGLAEMSMHDRVFPALSTTTPEGLWIASRLPNRTLDPMGDTDGTYGIDYLSPSEYGELLLLDPDTLAIERAWPLPAFPVYSHDQLVVADDAVLFSHGGDGGLPDSVIVRLDRATLEATVRVLPAEFDGAGSWPYDSWIVDEQLAFGPITVHADGPVLVGYEEITLLDPVTLAAVRTIVDGQPDIYQPGPDGTVLTVVDGGVLVLDAVTLQPVGDVPDRNGAPYLRWVSGSSSAGAVAYFDGEGGVRMVALTASGAHEVATLPDAAATHLDGTLHQLVRIGGQPRPAAFALVRQGVDDGRLGTVVARVDGTLHQRAAPADGAVLVSDGAGGLLLVLRDGVARWS